MIGPVCNQLVRFYAHGDIRRLYADDKVAISHILNDRRLMQRAFYQPFRGHSSVFFQKVFFQRSAVYPYPDRQVSFSAGIYHSPHPVFVPDISGIDADFIRSVRNSRQCKLIIKMNVGHKGDGNLFFDLRQRLCRFLCGNRTADNITACGRECLNLRGCRRCVLGFCICHGLYQNRIAAAYHPVSDPHCLGFHSFFLHTRRQILFRFYLAVIPALPCDIFFHMSGMCTRC